MLLIRVKTPAVRSFGLAPAGMEPANDNAAPRCRALVPVTPVEPMRRELMRRQASSYRLAEFVAQLLAAKNKAPQARERRRAEPAEALAAYRAAAHLTDAG